MYFAGLPVLPSQAQPPPPSQPAEPELIDPDAGALR
jgi:hypothetical protein